MDGMDTSDGNFLQRHFSDTGCHDDMANSITFHRTSRFPADSDHTGGSALYRVVRQWLHLSRMARIDRLFPLDHASHWPLLDDCCDAVGVMGIENF